MHVSNSEREKVVSISRTGNERKGRVSGTNVLLALAGSQEMHKYGFFHTVFGQTLILFTSCRVLILSGNYRGSLPVTNPPRMWAVS
jgi:hypothetical protein